MAAFLLVVLLAGTVAAGSYVRYPRATTGQAGGSMAGSGSGAVSSASSFSSSSSSSGTKVAPGPGGSGNVNAFAGMSNFGAPYPQDSNPLYRGGGAASGSQFGQSSFSGSGFPGSQSFSGSGFPGSQGFSGSQGFPGSQGFSGSQSFSGGGAASGSQFGQSSFSESQGFPGSQSFSGSQGFPGSQGAGFPGSQGAGFPGFPGYSPYVPQYGQQYPYVAFPNFAAPFDFMAFLNQYFQALQNFQAQAEAQAQQAAASGHGVYHKYPGGTVWSYAYPRTPFFGWVSGGLPVETNEVGGVGGLATATYSPQGGYGNANIFPKPEGGLDNRFGGDDETPQNSIGGGPVSSVSGSFKPPGGSSYGVFTSSASGSSDINGKKTSFKQSTIGVNDNGKVTTYTAHDP